MKTKSGIYKNWLSSHLKPAITFLIIVSILNGLKLTFGPLKKALFLTIFLSNILSCNIYLGEPPANRQLFDVRYFNDSDRPVSIVTYDKEKVIDSIKIQQGGSCWYNNVEIDFNGKIKNSPFKVLDGTVKRDSILIISNEIEINASGKKFKYYINLRNPNIDIDKKLDMFNLFPSTTIRLFNFKDDQKKLKVLSLNKGNYVSRNRIENSDFKNSLKMYDFEKRGL